MNKRQRKKMFKRILLNNLAEAFQEVKLMREGKLSKKIWTCTDIKRKLELIE